MALYLIIWSRTVIGVLLLVTGARKMMNLPAFNTVVREFALIPKKYIWLVASLVPFLELATGLLLLTAIAFDDSVMRLACVVATFLFIAFGTAIAINLMRGRHNISCGCFSNDEHLITWFLVSRNGALCVFSLAGLPSLHGLAQLKFKYDSGRLDAALVALGALLASQLYSSIGRLAHYGKNSLNT